MSSDALINVLLDEAAAIDELVETIREQREAVKNGRHAEMQELMKRVQDIFFRIQSQENQRERVTAGIAKELGCEAHFSALCEAGPETERPLFRGAGERLKHSVFTLKSEMMILNALLKQSETFGAMLISEWKRLEGNFENPGGLDFRG